MAYETDWPSHFKRPTKMMDLKYLFKRLKQAPDHSEKLWAAGFKMETYVPYRSPFFQYQQIHDTPPTEVTVYLSTTPYWSNGKHTFDGLNPKHLWDFFHVIINGEDLVRWEQNKYGIKLFRTEEEAQKYYAFATQKFYQSAEQILINRNKVIEQLMETSSDWIIKTGVE